MKDVTLDKNSLVITDGTSDGTQTKFYQDGIWYKMNENGYEGEAEYLCSLLLSCSNCNQYVNYEMCKINQRSGCLSNHFLQPNESFFSFEKLYSMHYGGNLTDTVMKYTSAEQRFEFVLEFIQNLTGLNLRTWLSNILMLDLITLNDDRHFNNLGVILCDNGKYREAPIFDNGAALLSNYAKYPSYYTLEENITNLYFQPFTGSAAKQFELISEACTLKIDFLLLLQKLENYVGESRAKEVLLRQIRHFKETGRR